jgi:hypothetical protein
MHANACQRSALVELYTLVRSLAAVICNGSSATSITRATTAKGADQCLLLLPRMTYQQRMSISPAAYNAASPTPTVAMLAV